LRHHSDSNLGHGLQQPNEQEETASDQYLEWGGEATWPVEMQQVFGQQQGVRHDFEWEYFGLPSLD